LCSMCSNVDMGMCRYASKSAIWPVEYRHKQHKTRIGQSWYS
jgi:hypothetical protein